MEELDDVQNQDWPVPPYLDPFSMRTAFAKTFSTRHRQGKEDASMSAQTGARTTQGLADF
jgi:hypothetical protein